MTALERFRMHIEVCDTCRNGDKEDLCPTGEGLRLDVFYEGIMDSPNTVRGMYPDGRKVNDFRN